MIFQLIDFHAHVMTATETITEISNRLTVSAQKYGLEIAPFKARWYNEALADKGSSLCNQFAPSMSPSIGFKKKSLCGVMDVLVTLMSSQ